MKQKPKIGIMQGRLSQPNEDRIQSFPINSWEKEFEIATSCRLDVIEWIFDEKEPNPILSQEGISKIKELMKKHNVLINSICADYFMTRKLFNESEYELEKNIKILNKLIHQANKLEISMIEIPLVDTSSLKNDENKIEIKKNLDKVISLAEQNNITIVLETDLKPQEFKELLIEFNNSAIMANYDSGNSASLGYNSNEELTILKKWIKNVHVKDRKLHGITVPFGTGDTDFELFFSSLSEINYTGDLIIQGARFLDKQITPKETCQTYERFVKRYVDKCYQ